MTRYYFLETYHVPRSGKPMWMQATAKKYYSIGDARRACVRVQRWSGLETRIVYARVTFTTVK